MFGEEASEGGEGLLSDMVLKPLGVSLRRLGTELHRLGTRSAAGGNGRRRHGGANHEAATRAHIR